MKWFGIAPLVILIMSCGGDGEESSAMSFLPSGSATSPGDEAEVESGGEGTAVEEQRSGVEVAIEPSDGEPSDGVCATGTFACQAGTLSTCENGAWVVVENCADPLACNPVEGNCGGCEANCADKECGDDGCGNSCGVCGPNGTCSEGTCQPSEAEIADGEEGGSEGSLESPEGGEESGGGEVDEEGTPATVCNPYGTGIQQGDYAKNIAWKEGSGDWMELHDHCGAQYVVLINSAPW